MFWGLLLQLCYKVTAEYAAETILKKIRQCLVKLQLWCIPFYGTLYTDFYRAVLLLVGWWCRLQKLIPLQYNHTKPSTLLLETCHVSMLLIVATCYVETSFTVFCVHIICWSYCQQSRWTLAADILYIDCQTRMKFDTLIEGSLLYINVMIGEL